jgi:hypothetical protein
VLKRRTHARAHALVGWLSGRLDLSVHPCGRARGVAGVGVVYQPINVLASQQSRATAVTADKVIKLINYCNTHPETKNKISCIRHDTTYTQ